MSRRNPDAVDSIYLALHGRYPHWWERVYTVECVFVGLAATVLGLLLWVIA